MKKVLRLLTDDWRQFVTKSRHLSWFYAGTVTAYLLTYLRHGAESFLSS